MAPLIIGYGNAMCGDDGAGPAAIALLEQAAVYGARLIACRQLTPELAVAVSEADCIIFIDAAAGGVAGSIAVQPIDADAAIPPGLTHALTPAAILAIARHLFGITPPARLITIAGADFRLGAELSPVVRRALPEAVALAQRLAMLQ
jgi:hydrogenase maturation protease